MVDYIHYCDLDEEIERLEALREIAKDFFGDDWNWHREGLGVRNKKKKPKHKLKTVTYGKNVFADNEADLYEKITGRSSVVIGKKKKEK